MLRLFTFFAILVFSFPIFAEGSDESDAPKTREAFLQRLLEKEEFKPLYESCRGSSDGVANCIWSELNGEQKKTIKKALKTYETDEEEDVAREYTGVDTSSGLSKLQKVSHSPGGEKIKEYFKNKLMHALLGEKVDEDGQSQHKYIDNHEVFYDLYQNRVSKNLIETMSSYCIEALPVESKGSGLIFIIPEGQDDRKKVRDYYVNHLLKNSASHTVEQGGSKKKTTVPLAYKYWNQCISSIQKSCERRDKIACGKNAFLGKINVCNSNKDYNFSSDKVTVKRACTVSDYLMKSRQALMRVEDIKEKWADHKMGREKIASMAPNNKAVNKYNPEDEENNINSLSTMSSKEVVEESGYSEEMKKKRETLKACKSGEIDFKSDQCQQFLTGDRKELDKELAEYDLRSRGVVQKIRDMKENGEKEQVINLLEEEGFNDDRIGELVGSDMEELRKEIEDRYDKKREALVESLSGQIEKKTVDTSKGLDSEKDRVFGNVQEELEEDSQRLKQLVHFNNIISGYLRVQGQGGKTYRNTASFYKEVESIEQAGDDSAFEGSVEELRKTAEKSKLKKTDAQDTQNATLDVQQLNESFLNYRERDKEKK